MSYLFLCHFRCILTFRRGYSQCFVGLTNSPLKRYLKEKGRSHLNTELELDFIGRQTNCCAGVTDSGINGNLTSVKPLEKCYTQLVLNVRVVVKYKHTWIAVQRIPLLYFVVCKRWMEIMMIVALKMTKTNRPWYFHFTKSSHFFFFFFFFFF